MRKQAQRSSGTVSRADPLPTDVQASLQIESTLQQGPWRPWDPNHFPVGKDCSLLHSESGVPPPALPEKIVNTDELLLLPHGL